MSKMTTERLRQYPSLRRQIRDYENRYKNRSILSAVDTTKPSVQSFGNSDVTADSAISIVSEFESMDYKKMVDEWITLNKYILSIEDETTKEIFKKVFQEQQSYSRVGNQIGYCKKQIERIINNYIANN